MMGFLVQKLVMTRKKKNILLGSCRLGLPKTKAISELLLLYIRGLWSTILLEGRN